MNANDLCDACSATAQVIVRSENELMELAFCGHHLNQHAAYLDSKGFRTVARQNTTGEEPVPA